MYVGMGTDCIPILGTTLSAVSVTQAGGFREVALPPPVDHLTGTAGEATFKSVSERGQEGSAITIHIRVLISERLLADSEPRIAFVQ